MKRQPTNAEMVAEHFDEQLHVALRAPAASFCPLRCHAIKEYARPGHLTRSLDQTTARVTVSRAGGLSLSAVAG